jgi:starch synthase
MSSRKFNILFVSAEVAPFAKVGGLADVAGGLPRALKQLGHDVRIVMPCYRMIETDPRWTVSDASPKFDVPIREGVTETAWLRQTTMEGDIPVYLVAHDTYFKQATESTKVYTLDPDPYIFFDRAVAEAGPQLGWTPDVLHCHDWQTGLVPVFLEHFYADSAYWGEAARVFTIHNLAYQGDFDPYVLHLAGLPNWMFTYDKLEYYGRINFLKGGVIYSDLTNTVSRTYANEIQTPEFGCGLDGLMRYMHEQNRLFGIVNGIDFEEYNPETDKRIPANFSAEKPAGKFKCRAALRKECGLPSTKNAPVIGLVSRFADQKGFDLIAAASEQILAQGVQLVVLGTGDPNYEKFFQELSERYPKQVKAFFKFDTDLAQRIYAGSDLFLMPSRFEPCGLGQLMALRYGTLPIVRSTGGLADTIVNYNARSGKGNGFAFSQYSPDALLDAVTRAVDTWRDEHRRTELVDRALRSDFSWGASARKYIDLYRRAVASIKLHVAA